MDEAKAAGEALAGAFEAAWNAHDMEAFGHLFHHDATFVNRFGAYWRGAERIVEEHAAIHRTIYQDMTIETRRVDVDPVGDGVAIVHIGGHAHMGPSMPHGPRVLASLMLLVLTRRDGEWRIQAGENVAVLDPRSGQPILYA